MKLSLLAIFVFVIIFSSSLSIAGQKCDTTIRKDHVAEDLSRAFACMDDRLNKLENNAIKTGGETDDRASSYDAGNLKISVRGASKDKEKIYVSLQMQNKTTEPMLVAVNEKAPPTLVEYKSGKAREKRDIQFISQISEDTSEKYYTPIPINGSITPSFVFYSRETTESAFTLNLALLRLKNGKVERLPASFKVIAE